MRAAFVMLAVAAAGACGGKKADGGGGLVGWLGKAPVPPGKLASLTPWMTADAAEPTIGPVELDADGAGVAGNVLTGKDDVTATAGFENGKLAWVIAYVRDRKCEDALAKAWGPGVTKDDPPGVHAHVWTNAAADWRAVMRGVKFPCEVTFEPYRVATAAFFTDHVGPPPVFAKLSLGMSAADAHAAAPDLIAAPGNDAAHTSGWVGVSDCKAHLHADTGQLTAFTLTCEPEVMSVIEQAWGPGKPAPELGDPSERVWHDATWEWRAHAAYEPGKAFVLIIERSPDPPPSTQPAPAK